MTFGHEFSKRIYIFSCFFFSCTGTGFCEWRWDIISKVKLYINFRVVYRFPPETIYPVPYFQCHGFAAFCVFIYSKYAWSLQIHCKMISVPVKWTLRNMDKVNRYLKTKQNQSHIMWVFSRNSCKSVINADSLKKIHHMSILFLYIEANNVTCDDLKGIWLKMDSIFEFATSLRSYKIAII